MSKRLLYGYLFLFMLMSVSYYFGGASGVLKCVVVYTVYMLVAFVIYWCIKKMLGRLTLSLKEFSVLYTYRLSVMVSMILFIGGSFVFYQNSINPAKMPLYVLTNGEKTLDFQAMSHIAQDSFYRNVQKSIAHAKDNGSVLFYEGVRPGSKENQAIFQNALGVEITPELYENFANLYGVTHQEQDDFLGIVNDLDYNVDLDIDRIVELYLKKNPKESAGKKVLQQDDLTAEVLDTLGSLNERQLQLLRYINKSLLNFMVKHDGLRNQIISRMEIEDIFGVILDDRNTYIAQEILTSDEDKIFAMYGLMHFSGIKELLQKADNNWEVVEISYSYPISSPAKFFENFGG